MHGTLFYSCFVLVSLFVQHLSQLGGWELSDIQALIGVSELALHLRCTLACASGYIPFSVPLARAVFTKLFPKSTLFCSSAQEQ